MADRDSTHACLGVPAEDRAASERCIVFPSVPPIPAARDGPKEGVPTATSDLNQRKRSRNRSETRNGSTFVFSFAHAAFPLLSGVFGRILHQQQGVMGVGIPRTRRH